MERFEKLGLYDPRLIDDISCGIHVCYLGDPIHLAQASAGLCNLVGYTSSEIWELFGNDYSKLIYPADVPRFEKFVLRLSKREGSETIFYRLLARDGRVIPIVDTMTSRVLEDGVMWGYSVINDLSALPGAMTAGIFEEDGVASYADHKHAPLHGMVRISCGDKPHVLSIDDGMLFILGVSEEEIVSDRAATIAKLELFYSDIINRVLSVSGNQKSPTGLKRTVIRRLDGSCVRVANWTSWKDSPKEKICQLFVVLEDSESSADEKIDKDMENFEKFSHEAADIVFSLNLGKGSLVCLKNSIDEFELPTGLPFVASEVLDIWFASHLCEEERSEAWSMVSPERIPFEGIIEHKLFHVLVGKERIPTSALLLSEGPRALLLLKFLKDVAGGGVFSASCCKGYPYSNLRVV